MRPAPASARNLIGATAIAWALVHLAGAWLVQPSFQARRIILIPRIDTPIHETFRGRLLAAEITGHVVSGPMESLTAAELESAQGREGRVSASATARPRPRARAWAAPMAMLLKPPTDIDVELAQLGSTLRFDVRSHAADARLRPLVFEMDRAFPGRSGAIGMDGERLELSAVLEPGRIRMAAESQGRRREWSGRIDPALVWVMLLPFELPVGPATTVGSFLWLFITLAPIGFWARFALVSSSSTRSARGKPEVPWASLGALWVALGAAGFIVVPAVMHVAYGTAWEWFAAAAGILTGFLLAPPCSGVAPAGRLRQ